MATEFGSPHGLPQRILDELQLMRPLLPTYAHLIVSAIFPIYAAAHASLVRPSSAAPLKKRKTSDDDDNDTDDEIEVEETSPKIETLTPSDALLFPIMAGCTLAGLYFILKFLQDPAWLNWFLGLYFACIGFFFMTRFLKDGFSVMRSMVLPRQYSSKSHVWTANNDQRKYMGRGLSVKDTEQISPFPGVLRYVPLPATLRTAIWNLRCLIYAKARVELSFHRMISLKMPVDILDFFSLGLTTLVIGYHTFIDKPWYLTNILGFSFCYGSLQFMTPGTSWTGTLLLAALFFYDIYFVFFTPMMVTVATKLDVPIKLLFPRPDGCVLPVGAEEGSAALEEYLKCVAKKRTMAMLGLGDIVIPGMMLAFALRFDLYLFYLRKTKDRSSQEKSDKQDENDPPKPMYLPATGAWGERFWVGQKFHAQLFSGKRFPKPYFYATVTGYIIGMLTTVLVMQIANHAQPALLYLVPGVLISLWGTALFKGDLKTLWNYSEIPVDTKESVKPNEKNGKLVKTIENTKTEEDHIDNNDQKQSSSGEKTESNRAPDQNRNENSEQAADRASDIPAIGPRRHLIYFAILLPEKKEKNKNSTETSQERLEDSKKITKPDGVDKS